MRQQIFPWRILSLYLLGLAAVLGIALYIIPVFFPWSEWNCRHQDIDINSGRLKFSRHVFFLKVSEEIRDSALSKVLCDDSMVTKVPNWQRVNTFSPGIHNSPHYSYHGAINDTRMLSTWWNGVDAPESVRIATAKHLIALWQHDDSDELSGRYLSALPYRSDTHNTNDLFATLSALRMPSVTTNDGLVARTVFYPMGLPMQTKQGFFNHEGRFILDGVFLTWRADGGISECGHFINGIVNGPWFRWDRNGTLDEIAVYEDGKQVDAAHERLSTNPYFGTAQRIESTNQPRIWK